MAGGAANSASGVQTIDALLGNFRWNSLNLTYNFPVSADYYNADTYFEDPADPNVDLSTFAPVSPSLGAAIDHAITSQLMAVAPLVYTKVDPTDAAADSSFARARPDVDAELGTPPGGLGFYPGIIDRGGDAWFNVDQARFNNVQIGNSAYWVVLHELGHTVGLKHGHGNDRPGPTTEILPVALNSMEYSVMTYRRYVGASDVPVANDTQADSFAQSLMMLDIQAIQHLYGADYTTNAGNTVYTFSTTTGEMFVDGEGQGTPSGNRIFRTIWDGDGVDTYDLSNYTSDLEIDLAPGGFSNFHSGQLAQLSIANNKFASGNVYNALLHDDDLRSLIENATGGSGDDNIRGNVADNLLIGNGGRDTLRGFEGNDTLRGGQGNDELQGGDDNDLLDGGQGADELRGGDGNDDLRGGIGNDELHGGTGIDRLNGGAGNDDFFGGDDSDIFDFGAWSIGLDTIRDWQDSSSGIGAQDVISLEGRDLSFNDLTILYARGDAYILAGDNILEKLTQIIVVENAARGSIGADDFLF